MTGGSNFDRNKPGGAMFPVRAKKNPKGPDYTGELVLDRAILEKLVMDSNAGRKVTLRLAGWTRTSQRNPNAPPFIAIGVDRFQDERQGSQQQGQQNAQQTTGQRNDLNDEIPFS